MPITEILDSIKITVLDQRTYFDADIDRDTNRLNGLVKITERPRFTQYDRTNNQEEKEVSPLNVAFLLRFESVIKLNVVTWEDQNLISPEQMDQPEVHFARVEWTVHDYPSDGVDYMKHWVSTTVF
jgi:hypothetical protein